MKTPHKHAELIKAWADGAEIEFHNGISWSLSKRPEWRGCHEYRIKPDTKPDVIRYGVASVNSSSALHFFGPIDQRPDNNLKLTFDGTTNKLIKAEVI